MKHMMVQYTVKADQVAENVRQIDAVFSALGRSTPAGVSYASYQLEDGATFVHVVSIENVDANPLRSLEEFQQFTSTVRDRCTVLPVTTVLQQIGRYTSTAPAGIT